MGKDPRRQDHCPPQKDVFPWLGGRAIAEIKAPEVLAVLHRVETRRALDTAHRVHQNCGQVFRYSVVAAMRRDYLSVVSIFLQSTHCRAIGDCFAMSARRS